MDDDLNILRQQSVYSKNNNGDKTHPWDDPVEHTRASDKVPLTLTLCGLLVSQLTNHDILPMCQAEAEGLRCRVWWSEKQVLLIAIVVSFFLFIKIYKATGL